MDEVETFSIDLFVPKYGKHGDPDKTVILQATLNDLPYILSKGRYERYCCWDAFDTEDHWVAGKQCDGPIAKNILEM